MSCAGFLGGCTAAETHPSIAAPGIQLGETTRGELIERLGEPERTGTEHGSALAAWWESQPSIVGTDRARELVVVFTPAGRVKSYELRSTFPADRATPPR